MRNPSPARRTAARRRNALLMLVALWLGLLPPCAMVMADVPMPESAAFGAGSIAEVHCPHCPEHERPNANGLVDNAGETCGDADPDALAGSVSGVEHTPALRPADAVMWDPVTVDAVGLASARAPPTGAGRYRTHLVFHRFNE